MNAQPEWTATVPELTLADFQALSDQLNGLPCPPVHVKVTPSEAHGEPALSHGLCRWLNLPQSSRLMTGPAEEQLALARLRGEVVTLSGDAAARLTVLSDIRDAAAFITQALEAATQMKGTHPNLHLSRSAHLLATRLGISAGQVQLLIHLHHLTSHFNLTALGPEQVGEHLARQVRGHPELWTQRPHHAALRRALNLNGDGPWRETSGKHWNLWAWWEEGDWRVVIQLSRGLLATRMVSA